MESMKKEFLDLINSYLVNQISPVEFEKKYMLLWREARETTEYNQINEESGGLFDHIFSALDCYCSDSALRDESDLDEKQLYAEVIKLMRITGPS